MESNEIKRTDLINFLIKKHGLTRYLEIGVQNPSQNFDKIECDYKASVDPDPRADAKYCMTSDMFFNVWTANINYIEFDLIFIDGLHTAEQLQKDFENALEVLSPNGFIILHDCNPLKEEHTIVPRPTERGHWNGDVYKFAAQLGSNWANFRTIDIDNGCGVFFKFSYEHSLREVPKSWDYFDKNRKELLNLISWDEFVNS